MNRTNGLVLLVWFFLSTMLCAEDLSSQSKFDLREYLVGKLLTGNVTVEGVVQDGAGNVLSNVSVVVQTGACHGENKTNKFVVSGKFHLELGRCSVVQMEFNKEGYDFACYDTGYKAESDHNYTSSSVVGSYVETNIVIVLYRSGELTLLPRHHNFITFEENLKWQALSLNGAHSAFKSYVNIPSSNYSGVANVWYLSCDTNEYGKIVVGSNGLPGNLCVRMTDPTGGFFDVAPASAPQAATPWKRLMMMSSAPVNSYTNALWLDKDRQQHFFYFRTKYNGEFQCYGKGFVNSPSLEKWHTNAVVKSAIDVFVQPNGTTNVRCRMPF